MEEKKIAQSAAKLYPLQTLSVLNISFQSCLACPSEQRYSPLVYNHQSDI